MELYGFIQFVNQITFEQTVLWTFIVFQKVVSYELLNSYRSKYQRLERGWLRRSVFQRNIIAVIFAIFVLLFTVGHSWVDEHKVHLWYLAILLPILTDYIFFFALVGVWLLLAMKQFQHLEYQTHKTRFGTIFMLTCLSLFGLTVAVYAFSQVVVCNDFQRRYQLPISLKRDDFCSQLLGFYHRQTSTGEVNFIIGQSMLILCTLLPYIVYFAIVTVMEPHDCFDCFNRIPVLRYSIFQFTIYERNFNRELQFGRGYVEMYNKMIKRAEESSRRTGVSDITNQGIQTIFVADSANGQTEEEMMREYQEQQMLFERMDGYYREQQHTQASRLLNQLAFDQREIPIDDQDVRRVGGSIYGSEFSSKIANEVLTEFVGSSSSSI